MKIDLKDLTIEKAHNSLKKGDFTVAELVDAYLEIIDERHIARDYGSAPALYNKLYTLWERMDRSQVGLVNDVVPSF